MCVYICMRVPLAAFSFGNHERAKAQMLMYILCILVCVLTCQVMLYLLYLFYFFTAFALHVHLFVLPLLRSTFMIIRMFKYVSFAEDEASADS